VYNESHISYFADNRLTSIKGHADVVSEYGFLLAKFVHEQKLQLDPGDLPDEIEKTIFESALTSIKNSSRITELPEYLTQEEKLEGAQLAKNINAFISSFNSKNVTFAPTLPGYGLVRECLGDVSIDNCLIEIKTVSRNFRSKDLKQLIIYLALGAMAGKYNWTSAALYNPRSCRFSKFDVEGLVGYLAGGRPSLDAFRHFLDSLSRDMISEQRF